MEKKINTFTPWETSLVFFSLGLWFCALLWTIGMCFFFEKFNDGKKDYIPCLDLIQGKTF